VDDQWLADRFEEHRAHLRGVAYRMLGSLEADDCDCLERHSPPCEIVEGHRRVGRSLHRLPLFLCPIKTHRIKRSHPNARTLFAWLLDLPLQHAHSI